MPFIFQHGGRNALVLAALKTAAPPNAEALLTPLLDDENPALRVHALRLAGAWKVTAFLERIRALAFEKKVAEALDALISLSPDEVAAYTLTQLATCKIPQEAASLISALVSKTEGHAALMRALRPKDALSATAAKTTLQALNNLGRTDANLSPLLMQLAGIDPALPAYTKDYVTRIVKSAQTFGDAAEGKRIYEQNSCIAWHIRGAAQSKIGPDLSAIGRGLPIDMIVAEVVWPSLNV